MAEAPGHVYSATYSNVSLSLATNMRKILSMIRSQSMN